MYLKVVICAGAQLAKQCQMPLQNLQTHNITFFSYFITYFVLIVYVTLSKFKGDLALTTEGYRCIAYFNDKIPLKFVV
jgi:hypothetical protein